MVIKDGKGNVSIKYERDIRLDIEFVARDIVNSVLDNIEDRFEADMGTAEWDELKDNMSVEELNQIYEYVLLQVIKEMKEL